MMNEFRFLAEIFMNKMTYPTNTHAPHFINRSPNRTIYGVACLEACKGSFSDQNFGGISNFPRKSKTLLLNNILF